MSWLMRVNRRTLALWMLFCFGGLFLLKGRITGDGFSYYAWLRSPVFDRDVNFYNEYTEFNPEGYWTAVEEETATGLVANPFSIGPAVLWLPWFGMAYLLTELTGPGLAIENDGYSFYYQLLIPLGTYVYAFMGALFLFQLLRLFTSQQSAWWATFAVVFASPMLNYLYNEPVSSHPLSFFIISAFYFYWLSTKRFQSDVDSFLGGLVAGLMCLVRWQQIIFVLPVFYDKLLVQKRPFQLSVFGFALGIIAVWQLAAWKLVYGSFFHLPQTTAFFIPPTDILTWASRLPLLWFSPNHGLFYWTPLMLLGIYGWYLWRHQKKRLSWQFALLFLLSSLVNALPWEYYGGWAYGSRRMIESLPLIAVGLAVVFDQPPWHKLRGWVVGVFTLWNALLWAQYVALQVNPVGALVFPDWVIGQFTQSGAGIAKAFGQSAVLSQFYFALQEGQDTLALGIVAAVIVLLVMIGVGVGMYQLEKQSYQ